MPNFLMDESKRFINSIGLSIYSIFAMDIWMITSESAALAMQAYVACMTNACRPSHARRQNAHCAMMTSPMLLSASADVP